MSRGTGTPKTNRIRTGRVAMTVAKYAFLVFWAAVSVLPLVLIVSTAFKDPLIETGNPFQLFSSFRPQNIIDAWTLGNFGRYFLNTLVIMIPVVVGVILLSTMVGYALARFEFPGRSLVFYLFILGMMVPFFSALIPLYYNLRDYGLLNTPWAVILPLIAGAGGTGLPLGVFLMRAFFLDLPDELGDAARIDGADEWGVFHHIMVPLAIPGASALAVFAFMSAWSTFLLPLLYLAGEKNRTLATALLLFSGGRTQEVELLSAGTLIMVAPVILFFLVLQKQFIQGLTAGATKG